MKIVIVLNVDGVDPTRVDPHEIVEDLLALHEVEWQAGNVDGTHLSFVSAEWDGTDAV